MILNTNVQALLTTNALWHRNNSLQKASTNLSLGTKINKSGDEPAGLAVANKMRMQIKGLEMADRNVNDAISMIQTAEGGVSEMGNMVQRMRELAVQASNDTLTKEDRETIQREINELSEEIDAVSEKIEFNKKKLLNEDYEKLIFQVGGSTGQELEIDMKNINSEVLGVSIKEGKKYDKNGNLVQPEEQVKALDYTTVEDAQEAITRCDEAIERINNYRATIGSTQNRLEKTSNSLVISEENTKAALSRVVDTDMAEEMSEYTKNNVLVQSGIAMLSQANQRPNQLLSLLQ
ncbi:flagellin N-terminal helical domain-containing protein [[Clostridium] colinum]|uniref:flagellin N-terminal helical domain-containing protein n=1 Tax=[Clostridium] colinum TaxID=36835 RepID=UPI00202444A4|nr:flagellin [[Clostridium] colinum]